MTTQRKKVGRPKVSKPWSSSITFRPYICVDFRKDPAIHCLLFDNPSDLTEMLRRGLELAMAEKGAKYLDPAFQQSFAMKAVGLWMGNNTPSPTPYQPPQSWDALPAPAAPPAQPAPVAAIPAAPVYHAPVQEPPPAPVQIQPVPTPGPIPDTPEPKAVPAGMTAFLAKALADSM